MTTGAETEYLRVTRFTATQAGYQELAAAAHISDAEVRAAVRSLEKRGLASIADAKIAVAPAAARRSLTPPESAVVDHLLQVERDIAHPRVGRVAGVCGGEPVVVGTGVAAEAVANYFFAGKGVADVQRDYPHLSADEILDALHYVLDQRKMQVARRA
jgi:uncharacterized protein (DUF433 family)